MTLLEFENEFNIQYDSIASMDAPGLDAYEISVFLTRAQLELVKEHFGDKNKYQESFEGSSKRRADLKELVKPLMITPTMSTDGLTPKSFDVTLPSDHFMTVYEVGYYTPPGCENSEMIEIVPIKYDELSNMLKNPFRGPLKKRGFRLDLASLNGNKRSEIVVGDNIEVYQIRYVKRPSPIVLTDLGGISSEPLSIDGVVLPMECELDEEFHREILDRAVQLAMMAYKPEMLQANVQLGQRNN